jgi:hypothetical protein
MIEDLKARVKDFIILNFWGKIYPEEIEKFYTKAFLQSPEWKAQGNRKFFGLSSSLILISSGNSAK